MSAGDGGISALMSTLDLNRACEAIEKIAV